MPSQQAKQQVARVAELKQQVARLRSLVHRLAIEDMAGIRWTWWMNLHDFNDDEDTTQEDAVLALKRARFHIEEHQEREDQPA